MSARSVKELKTVSKKVHGVADAALNAGNGVLRLAPNWVPRVFCYPGRRLKLHPDDLFAFGLDRGGIGERWFGSTTEAANAGRVPVTITASRSVAPAGAVWAWAGRASASTMAAPSGARAGWDMRVSWGEGRGGIKSISILR